MIFIFSFLILSSALMKFFGMPILENYTMIFFSLFITFVLVYYNWKIKFNFKQRRLNSNGMFIAFLCSGLGIVLFYIIGVKQIDGILENAILQIFSNSNLFVLLVNILFLCMLIFINKSSNIKINIKKILMNVINFYILLYIAYFSISFFLLLVGFNFDNNKAFVMTIEKIFEMKIERYEAFTKHEIISTVFQYVYYIYLNSIYIFMLFFLYSIIMRRRSLFFMSGGLSYIFNGYKLYGNYKKFKLLLNRSNHFNKKELKKADKKRLRNLQRRGIFSIEKPIGTRQKRLKDIDVFIKNEKKKEKQKNSKFLSKKINFILLLNKNFYFFVKRNTVNFLLSIFYMKIIFTLFVMILSFFGIINLDNELRFYKSNTLILFCIIVICILFDNKVFSQKFEKETFSIFFCFLIMSITIQNILYTFSDVPLLSYVILFFVYKLKDVLYNNSFIISKYVLFMFYTYIVYEILALIVSQSSQLLNHQSLYIFILATLVFNIEKYMKLLTSKNT